MNFFKKIGNAFGYGSTGAGGTRDAFEQYQKYIAQLLPAGEAQLSALLGQGQNPYLGRIAGQWDGQETGIDAFVAKAQAIPGLLRTSALASTEDASVAAAAAARQAAGGRGMAFSGATADIAGQAAGTAATARSAALAQALVQGEQFGVDTMRTAAEMRMNLGALRSGALAQEAGLFENRFNTEANFRQQLIAGQYGLAGAGMQSGLAGQQAYNQGKRGLLSLIMG